MRKLIALSLAALVVLVGTGRLSVAADVRETGIDSTKIGTCSMTVEGEIKAGDSAQIEALLEGWGVRQPSATHLAEFTGLDYVVCLSGSKGDYHEAIKIAEVFDAKMVATSVPNGAECSGACAIAFMGGRDCCVEMGRTMVKRHLAAGSALGLGAPAFGSDDSTYSASELSAAFENSLQVITELQSKAEAIRISSNVINKIVSHRNGDMYYIRPDPAHQHNYVDEDGKVFQDIWVPGVSGVVNQGTLDQ